MGYAKHGEKFRPHDVCSIHGHATILVLVCIYFCSKCKGRGRDLFWARLLANDFCSQHSNITRCVAPVVRPLEAMEREDLNL